MRQRGFTLIGLLFLVAGLGVALATVGTAWQTAAKREKEKELLFVGEQFRMALTAYRNRTPNGQTPYPKNLEDLVLDARFPYPVRHLRKIYRDPVRGTTEWGLVRVEGTIRGIHSLSQELPMKTSGFPPENAGFEGRSQYAQWVFAPVDAPPTSPAGPVDEE